MIMSTPTNLNFIRCDQIWDISTNVYLLRHHNAFVNIR
jgi:hypothetical protein